VETQTAFVWADGVVELNAVGEVDVHLALVVDPGHLEGEDAVGLYDALDDFGSLELRVLVVYLFDGFEYLVYSLQVFLFTWVFFFQVVHYLSKVHSC
jgi:hypothetical protein